MVNPIVFSGMVQRTQDISTIKQNENAKPQFEQVFLQQKNQKDVVLKHESVIKKDNADKEQKKFDAKEKGNGEYFANNKKGKQNQKDVGKVIKKDNKGSFDVSV